MVKPMRRMLSVLLATVIAAAAFAVPALADGPIPTQTQTLTVAQVAAKAKPSVVGILTTMKTSSGTNKGRAAGTGWVYKADVIITNAHVVENAQEVKILYADKTVETVAPSQIFADKETDVAVIKVTTKGLKPLPVADSDTVVVGETVVAVGNPLGFRLGNSVSAGILSGTGRALGSGYPFLQFDAAINPGNSGGPLFNTRGEVIGINSMKMAEFGVEGLSFAIPSKTFVDIGERLLTHGRVERATLGIALDEGWEAYFGVPDTEGVTIAYIIDDGPVGKTGLRSGDKLIKLDQTPIYTADDVYGFVSTKKPGDQVTITVKRSGQLLTVRVTLISQEGLRKIVEEQGGNELGGILMGLTDGQVQEAADFGRRMSTGYAPINRGYFGASGSDYAVLWTEYLYVARRVASAYDFGFKPGIGFQQSVAKEIANKVEVQMEIHGDKADFLTGATYMLEQEGVKKVLGNLNGSVVYTTSPDGKVVIATLAVRFSTLGLSATEDVVITVKKADGKTVEFRFTINDLR